MVSDIQVCVNIMATRKDSGNYPKEALRKITRKWRIFKTVVNFPRRGHPAQGQNTNMRNHKESKSPMWIFSGSVKTLNVIILFSKSLRTSGFKRQVKTKASHFQNEHAAVV